MQLIEHFTLFQPSQGVKALAHTTMVKRFVSLEECLVTITKNYQQFRSLWYAGSGWDNFSSLFSRLASELTGVPTAKLNWDDFTGHWDLLYGPYESHGVQYAYFMREGSNEIQIKDFFNEFAILLHKLCQ